MRRCKLCDSKLEPIISFGKMPIANGFISDISQKEYFYNLELFFCPNCFMVQLGETVPADKLFNESYAFISSTSELMASHFKEVAEEIISIVSSKKSPFIIELGCNDGIMLKRISSQGVKHLGIEPSRNVAELAKKNEVNVKVDFFNYDTALKIKKEYGASDIIFGANVMCHIEDLNCVFKGIEAILKDDGLVFFEDPYLLDIIGKTSFDQIYDEHIYYFSGLSIRELASRYGFQLVDMIHQDVHGGSMRYYLRKGFSNKINHRVSDYLSEEIRFNLNKIEGYRGFKKRVDTICNHLKDTLLKIKREGSHVVGYGATSKSTTLLNYAKISPDIIDYISDITPTKINKFSPGMHIPIKSYEHFKSDQPPYTVLFAWNHKEEIFKKEKDYRNKGGKFILYFPDVSIE